MMLLATVSMVVPSTFHRFLGGPAPGPAAALDRRRRGRAADRVRALPGVHAPDPPGVLHVCQGRRDGPRRALEPGSGRWDSRGRPRSARAWMSEILVGAAEATGHALGMSPLFIGDRAPRGRSAAPPRAAPADRDGPQEPHGPVRRHRDGQLPADRPLRHAGPGSVEPLHRARAPDAGIQPRSRSVRCSWAVLIGGTDRGDGRSNWYKGVQLVAFYLILATMFYLIPTGRPNARARRRPRRGTGRRGRHRRVGASRRPDLRTSPTSAGSSTSPRCARPRSLALLAELDAPSSPRSARSAIRRSSSPPRAWPSARGSSAGVS